MKKSAVPSLTPFLSFSNVCRGTTSNGSFEFSEEEEERKPALGISEDEAHYVAAAADSRHAYFAALEVGDAVDGAGGAC